MKSRRTHLAWVVSFVLHFCLAVVVGYFAISLNQQKIQDAIDVSFFIVSPPEVAQRDPVSKPVVVATPAPNLQVVPQTETTPRRTTLTRHSKVSMTAAPTAPLTAGSPAALKTQHVNVSNSPSVLQHTTEALSTAAVLPTTSDALPTAGLRGGGVTTGSVGTRVVLIGWVFLQLSYRRCDWKSKAHSTQTATCWHAKAYSLALSG